ncbi:MAG: RNA 2',3'-cyclic phosphodiesterase [Candidatus Neomarinimicrobiota bacterium]
MGERLLRTFVSIPLPADVLKVISRLKYLTESPGRIKWSRPGQIHLTLKYLGHTPPDSVPEILSVLERCLKNVNPFELKLKGTGCFPGLERPRILWLGVGGSLHILKSLVHNINSELESLGFPRELHNYHPHISLGRIKYPQKNTPDISRFIRAEIEPIPIKVIKFQFMSSELFSNGPVYTILGTRFL